MHSVLYIVCGTIASLFVDPSRVNCQFSDIESKVVTLAAYVLVHSLRLSTLKLFHSSTFH